LVECDIRCVRHPLRDLHPEPARSAVEFVLDLIALVLDLLLDLVLDWIAGFVVVVVASSRPSAKDTG
jgi:hypothetical protein